MRLAAELDRAVSLLRGRGHGHGGLLNARLPGNWTTYRRGHVPTKYSAPGAPSGGELPGPDVPRRCPQLPLAIGMT